MKPEANRPLANRGAADSWCTRAALVAVPQVIAPENGRAGVPLICDSDRWPLDTTFTWNRTASSDPYPARVMLAVRTTSPGTNTSSGSGNPDVSMNTCTPWYGGVVGNGTNVAPVSRKSWSSMRVIDAGDSACLLYTSDAADERSSVDL